MAYLIFLINETAMGIPGTEGPCLSAFLDLEKTVLHEIRVSGTVEGPLLTLKSPTIYM